MDLLNCPFCGGEGSLASGVGEYWGRCMTCDASAAMSSVAERAIIAWNTRAPSEAVLVEALELAVAVLEEANMRLDYDPDSLGALEMEEALTNGYAALAAAKGERV